MAQSTVRDPGVALLWSWLVPGAGHWYGGRRGRAALYGATVAGIFVAGLVLGGISSVSVAGHKWAFLLQVFDGPLTLAVALVSRLLYGSATMGTETLSQVLGWRLPLSEMSPSRMVDLGLTLTLVAAALNILVMADAYFLADKPDVPEKAEEASA